ncbi:MAG: hypothetical protein KJN87_02085, partial [Desulfofustis sp.]|nr:hypothetical protein [Desulfofustis sp.]
VLLSFVSVYLIQQTRFSHLTPYIDPLLVLTVVLISILFPIRMAWQALMELLNRAPPSNLSNKFVSLSCPCCPNWILKKILRAVK